MEKAGGQILIECPNTIFHLYIKSEQDLSKIETFMNNIRTIERLGLNDIYTWCNRQGILYDTAFNYHKETSLEKYKGICQVFPTEDEISELLLVKKVKMDRRA